MSFDPFASLLPSCSPVERFGLWLTLRFPPTRETIAAALRGYPEPQEWAWALEGCAVEAGRRLLVVRDAWAAHPDGGEGVLDAPLGSWFALGVYAHPPGRGGATESFLLAPLASVMSPRQFDWCTSRMGDFAAISPVPHDVRVDARRIGFVNNSTRSRASRGFFARQRLKEILPRPLHRYVTAARRAYRRPKHRSLPGGGRPNPEDPNPSRPSTYLDPHGRVLLVPEWYHATTKAELFLGSIPDRDQRWIAAHLPLDVFWRAAVGDVEPAALDDLLHGASPAAARSARDGQPDLFFDLLMP